MLIAARTLATEVYIQGHVHLSAAQGFQVWAIISSLLWRVQSSTLVRSASLLFLLFVSGLTES